MIFSFLNGIVCYDFFLMVLFVMIWVMLSLSMLLLMILTAISDEKKIRTRLVAVLYYMLLL